MELAKLSVLLVALILSSRIDAVPFSTEIQPEPDYMGRAVIILPEEENATVTFQCVSRQSGDLRITVWFIQRSGESQMPILVGNTQFIRSGSENQNLTVTNITQDLDRAEISCGPVDNQIEPRFLLGFEATAQLSSTGVIAVREGESISVSLEADGNSPFSPVVTFQWMYNGADLNSSQRISLVEYNISITGVQREDAGDYQLVVSNSAGFGVGNLTLDVMFGPDATDVSVSPLYFVAGTNGILIAFANIEGNPEPFSTWTLNSNAISSSDMQFNTSVAGQLSITNISSADGGMYMCTLSNGNSTFDMSATIELSEAVLPTMPENVTASEINSTSARLTWDAPSAQGTFSVSFYRVRLVPSPSDEVIETTMTETFVSGLLPGTEYNVTVAAVVNDTRLLSLEAEIESLSALFNTSVSAPLFDEVFIVNDEGFINISWTFLHTGGLAITAVESVCNTDDGDSGSGYDLMSVLSCTETNVCSDGSLMGSVALGPVEAGATYTCTVTAFNANGSDVEERGNLTSDIGIPSSPLIRERMILAGGVVLTVETMSPGGPTVYFNVTFSAIDAEEYETITLSASSASAIEGANLTIPVPSGGSFSFVVLSFNSFGSLGITDSIDVKNVPPGITTSTTSQPPAPTSSGEPATTNPPSAPPGGLSGGAVAGIVIAILIIAALIFLIVLVVVYLYIKNRGESYQVDKGQKKSTVKMDEVEVDIGTELESRPAEEPQKLKLHEVQYADLEHFRKKEQTPDDTTPLATSPTSHPAVEPVTYSEIQPQPPKPESGSLENGSQPNAADGSDPTSI